METPLRILIVEDDLFMATDMEESLGKSGYIICGKATSYEAAIRSMEQSQPDIVLMDIMLNGPL